jgi:hypothetical protein
MTQHRLWFPYVAEAKNDRNHNHGPNSLVRIAQGLEP